MIRLIRKCLKNNVVIRSEIDTQTLIYFCRIISSKNSCRSLVMLFAVEIFFHKVHELLV